MTATLQAETWTAVARQLRQAMRGRVVSYGDEDYASARHVWNRAVDHRPGIIAFCESVEDVQVAVLAARAHALPASVRGAGLDATGRSVRSEGLVIDLSAMNALRVEGRTLTCG